MSGTDNCRVLYLARDIWLNVSKLGDRIWGTSPYSLLNQTIYGFSYTNPGRAWTIHESCPHTIVRSGRPELSSLTTMQLKLSPSSERQQQNQPPYHPSATSKVQSLGHVLVQAKSPQCRSSAALNHERETPWAWSEGKGEAREGVREGAASLRPIKPVRTSFELRCDTRGVGALRGGNGARLTTYMVQHSVATGNHGS